MGEQVYRKSIGITLESDGTRIPFDELHKFGVGLTASLSKELHDFGFRFDYVTMSPEIAVINVTLDADVAKQRLETK